MSRYCITVLAKIYLTSVKQEYAINHKEKSFSTYLMFLWEQILSISNEFKFKGFASWKDVEKIGNLNYFHFKDIIFVFISVKAHVQKDLFEI